MATITSNGSGLWNAGATWVGGVAPVDNDAVVIATGHVVEFNEDMSNAGVWPNGIAGITVTGTLSLTRTAGTHYLKIKAATTIGGAGTFDCGTAVSPIPFSAKHTITGGAGWYIKGNDGAGLTMTVYAAEPAIKTVRLIGAEAIGSTVLEVDTDITGDIWADADTIRIDNINKGFNTEERVIAAGGRAAGAITITAGLTAAKIAGTLVHLISRNVKILSSATNAYIGQNFNNAKIDIAGGEWWGRGFYSCSMIAISGGSFRAGDTFSNYGTQGSISGGVFSGFTGYVLQGASNLSVSGGIFSGCNGVIKGEGVRITGGLFAGNGTVVNGIGHSVVNTTFNGNYAACTGNGFVSDSIITNNAEAGLLSWAGVIKNVTFSGNLRDLRYVSAIAFNTLFGSANEFANYQYNAAGNYSESIDHDQIPDAYKAWTAGGVTSSQAVTVPTGYTNAMRTVLENATVEGYWQKEVLLAAGASVKIAINLRKDASMTYLPRCIIFNKAQADPFAGGAGVHTFTMTDSVDTWEAETYTYSNNTANDVTLVIRVQGMNASGSVYSALKVDVINVDLTSALAILNDLHDTHIPAIKTDTAAIKLKTDNLPSDPADESLLEAAIAAIPAAPTVDAILDEAVEGAYTLRQALRIMLASLAGKATGGGTATITFRNLADDKDRIVATVDVDGNRSAVVLDVT